MKTRDPIQVRFLEFHGKNPAVYERLVRLARQAKERGKSRISVKMLYEVVRWYHFLETEDETAVFKLSNDYHSRYARLIMKQEPDLDGLFATKRLDCDATLEIQEDDSLTLEDDVTVEIVEDTLGAYLSDYWTFQAAS